MLQKNPSIQHVWIGSTDKYLADVAKEVSADACLCDDFVYHQILNQGSSCQYLYTAIGDLNIAQLYDVLTWAQNIYFVEPAEWKDNVSRLITIELLKQFKNKIQIGLDIVELTIGCVDQEITQVENYRVDNQASLFVVGCSVAHGVGVESCDSYAHLLKEQINRPLVMLTKSSSSISWAADQILRSDIRSGDIVVWTITSPHRTWWFNIDQTIIPNKLITHHCNLFSIDAQSEFNEASLLKKYMVVGDTHLLIQSIRQIYQVINFCQKIGATLYYTFLPFMTPTDLEKLNSIFAKNPGYVNIPFNIERPYWEDLGSDNLHPGKKTHKRIANCFFEKIQN